MVESGVPTICSRLRSFCTRSRPLKPVATEPTPKAISTTLARMPPYWKNLLISAFPSRNSVDEPSLLARGGRAIRAGDGSSVRGNPQLRGGEERWGEDAIAIAWGRACLRRAAPHRRLVARG